MRNKYKKKQLQVKNEDSKLTKEIPRKEQSNFRRPLNQNISQLNMNKSSDRFHKYINNNDSNRDNESNRFTAKNASSISFKKEMARSDTFNKIFDDKKFKKYLKNKNYEKNEKNEKKDELSYTNIKKLNKFNLNKDTLINKIYNTEKNQRQNTNNINNNNNNTNNNDTKENNSLNKNNSQRFSTIIRNTTENNNNRQRNSFLLRTNINCENIDNNNNSINNTEIRSSGNYKTNDINIDDNNNKNYLKLNKIDNKKNYCIYNNSSRNRIHINNNGDYFSNRKNKNINLNKNLNTINNNSLNEKSNSLSIISEKISLLNSYEENSNSLQKEEIRESTRDKKIFSSKMKIENYNSEKNAKNYFNIIETEIKEENENSKFDKNSLFRNRRNHSIIPKSKRFEDINQNSFTPKISNDTNRKQYNKSTINNETKIRIDDNINNKVNDINYEDNYIPKTISSSNVINKIRKDNYIMDKRGKNNANILGSFRRLNDNNNYFNNLTEKHKTNKSISDNSFNRVTINESINLEHNPLTNMKRRWKGNRNNDSYLKSENNDILNNNKEKRINKEINIISNNNNNNNNFQNENNIKNDDNTNNNNNPLSPLMKKTQTLPLKSFKFLVHQANYNNVIKDSFNKYYEEKKLNNNNNAISAINANNINNMNESLTLSTETNFSGKARYNNVLSDLLDLSKRDYFKSPANNINNFCFANNNNEYIQENNNDNDNDNKKQTKISIKQKLIKTNKNDFLNNMMNTSYDNDKNNYNYNNYFTNKIKNNKNYGNEIINNNIYSTTLNIYKINDNNTDDISQIKSILAPTLKTNILFKNNDNKNSGNIINLEDNNNHNIINNNSNFNINSYKMNNNIPSLCYSNNSEILLFYNLEKKILLLLNKIEEYKACKNECYDYINYYFENRIDEHIKNYFMNNHNRINIINYIKLELLCYFLCYDIANSKFYNQAAILIKSIMTILNNNYLLIILLILSNINKNTSEKNKELSQCEKIIISELNIIIKNYLTIRVDEESINELYIVQNISNSTKDIDNYYKMILDNLYKDYYSLKSIYNTSNKYKFPNCLKSVNYANNERKIIIIFFFYDSYRLLNSYKIIDLKTFFDEFLDRTNNFNFETEVNEYPITSNEMAHTATSQSLSTNSLKSKILSKKKDISVLSKNKYKLFILPDINRHKYKYSLILSLNEILIYFDKSICNYMIRPGLFEFLKEMKEIYELILYTTNFSDYEEQIMDNLQKNNNYFDYILTRKNGIDNSYNFIQDLVSLNRNIKQFIIIDTAINKFKTHKNNILTIKPFYGDIRNDKNTLNFLSQLLQRIRIDAESSEDIRISINKYKKSFIYSKIAK